MRLVHPKPCSCSLVIGSPRVLTRQGLGPEFERVLEGTVVKELDMCADCVATKERYVWSIEVRMGVHAVAPC